MDRELQNIIERLAIVSELELITLKDIPDSYRTKAEGFSDDKTCKNPSLKDVQEEAERRLLENVLRNNKSSREAAKELGVSQATFLRKAHKYGVAFTSKDE